MVSIRSLVSNWDAERVIVVASVSLALVIAINTTVDGLMQLLLILILSLVFGSILDFLYDSVTE